MTLFPGRSEAGDAALVMCSVGTESGGSLRVGGLYERVSDASPVSGFYTFP